MLFVELSEQHRAVCETHWNTDDAAVLTGSQCSHSHSAQSVRACVCGFVCLCLLPRATATTAPAEAAGVGPLGILSSGHAPVSSRPAQGRCLAATSPHGQLAPSLGRDRTCVLHRERESECYLLPTEVEEVFI